MVEKKSRWVRGGLGRGGGVPTGSKIFFATFVQHEETLKFNQYFYHITYIHVLVNNILTFKRYMHWLICCTCMKYFYICTLLIDMFLFVSLNDFQVQKLKFYRSKREREKPTFLITKQKYMDLYTNIRKWPESHKAIISSALDYFRVPTNLQSPISFFPSENPVKKC